MTLEIMTKYYRHLPEKIIKPSFNKPLIILRISKNSPLAP